MNMKDIETEALRLFEAKEARRLALRRLSFPEKVRMIIQLQKMSAPLLRARGKRVRVWTPTP
ncbi:MAG TPA: hypothetical protein VFY29_19535 [Terriglobia bacterium]|nr:hypothetical protein [Terriglobia bacterium]